jgi:hypothetical protein
LCFVRGLDDADAAARVCRDRAVELFESRVEDWEIGIAAIQAKTTTAELRRR